MSYTKKTWSTGDTITADALNNLESGASANAAAIAEIEKELPTYVGADVPRKAAATITPGTTDQTIAANQYLTGAQTVKGDGNLSAGNIKKGVSIFGVSGTLETGSTGTDTSDATATAGDILYGETAYVRGEKVTGTIKSVGAATITPGTENQTIASGQYLAGAQTIKGDSNLVAENIKSGVSIFGVTGTLEAGSTGTDTSDATATAGDILSGKTAYVNGEKVTGTITPKAAQVYKPKTTDQTILAGYYLKGNQTIEGDANLVAANIKSGVSIFGVTGTLESGSGSGAVVKTGTFKGTGGAVEVDTGLSSISYFIAYDAAKTIHAQGIVVAIMDSAHNVSGLCVSCSSYSQYFKNIGISTSGVLTVSGGKVSFPGASTANAPISNATYSWVAVGEA